MRHVPARDERHLNRSVVPPLRAILSLAPGVSLPAGVETLHFTVGAHWSNVPPPRRYVLGVGRERPRGTISAGALALVVRRAGVPRRPSVCSRCGKLPFVRSIRVHPLKLFKQKLTPQASRQPAPTPSNPFVPGPRLSSPTTARSLRDRFQPSLLLSKRPSQSKPNYFPIQTWAILID